MLAEFLTNLFEEGRATVGPLAPLGAEELEQCKQVLSRYEAIHRLDLPGNAPDFSPPAASWAASCFYRACQMTAYRGLGEEVVRRELSEPFPGQAGPSEHYSVDLVFRYLPDLFHMAHCAASQDPLLEVLRHWGRAWPLSSVGMPDLGDVDASVLLLDDSLSTLYIDRITTMGDVSRLRDQRACDRVRVSLGMHPQLAAALNPATRSRLSLGAE